MLIFTSFFTLPFMYFLVCYGVLGGSFFIHLNSNLVGVFARFLFLFVFSVKLPIYGLHFWLPIAHVEAPTFGSIVLAGVLLKLGGVGLIRVLSLVDFLALIRVLLAYFVIFTVYSTLVCCSQSDFKRLVAYSSVAHMIVVPILIVADELLRIKIACLGMFIHGLASPLMFMLVGIYYFVFGTRQMVFMRGLLTISPLLSFLSTVAFFVSVSAPPFPGFVSEVYSFLSVFRLSGFIILVFLFVPVFSMVYNVL